MGLLDRILNRPPKQTAPVPEPTPPQPASQPASPQPASQLQPASQSQETKSTLNLTKEIGLTFEKLNLDKEDVRKKKQFALDISGSMGEPFGHGKDKKRKIDSLKEVMSKYPDANMLCFASSVKKINNASEIPNPNGGTNLAYALRYISENITPKPEGLVLVSDGEPDNESDALKEAKKLAVPVDIIFIGDKNSRGERFMETLAKETGGQHFVIGG